MVGKTGLAACRKKDKNLWILFTIWSLQSASGENKLYVCQQGNSFIIWYIHTVEYWAAKKKEVNFFEMTQKITMKILTGKFLLNSRLNVVDLIFFLKLVYMSVCLCMQVLGKFSPNFLNVPFEEVGGNV